MTQYELRNTDGKIRTVAAFTADTDPRDDLAVAMLLRDQCKARRLNPTTHELRSWSQRTGWTTHGGGAR